MGRRAAFDAYAARFRANAVRRKNVDDAVARASEPGGMKKARVQRDAQRTDSASDPACVQVLGAFDLVLLGIGGIIGAGVFVLTGVAARDGAGPAVILSYMLAAFASFLAALCYTEFAVELPVAGSAYNYVAVTFGELPAFLVGCDLVLEYTISAAAVARGWTSYAATLVGLPSNAFRLGRGLVQLDVLALLNVFAQSGILCVGMRESSNFNIVVNIVNLCCIAFVLLAGSAEVDTANYSPFLPYGVSGVFSGASIVFFSFIGFDTVATAAEEVRNPGRDLPLGIIGSLVICTGLYAAMCAVITGMVPYDTIDRNAPFAVAFTQRGMGWAASIVSAGAITGITTSLLVSLLGQPRIYMTMARDGLLPAWFARVHPKRGTPVNATVVTGLSAGLLALLVDIDALAQLVSIGTLCVFCFVCAAVLARRYMPPDPAPRAPVLMRVAGVAASALIFAFATELLSKRPAAIAFATPVLLLYIGLSASFLWLPQHYKPKKFAVPLMPFVPCLGMYATLQLIASLGPIAWLRFIVYYTLCSCIYAYYRGGTDPAVANAAAAALASGARPVADEAGVQLGELGGGAAADAQHGEAAELLPAAGGAGAAAGGGVHRRHNSSDSDGDDGLALGTAAARRAEKRAAKVALLGAS